MNQRVINQAAFLMAKDLLQTIQTCLRPEEHRDAFQEFFTICKNGLEAHQVQTERMEKRLRPGATRADVTGE